MHTRKIQADPEAPETTFIANGSLTGEMFGRDSYLWALAIGNGRSYGLVPQASSVLAEARPAGRGKGWWVSTPNEDSEADSVRIEGLTKAQARTKVREIARAYAKKLRVPLNIEPVREW